MLRRRLEAIGLAAVAAAAFGLVAAAPASAIPCCNTDYEYIYYSNASHSAIVGEYYEYGLCGTSWGTATPYYVVQTRKCLIQHAGD